MTGCREIWRGYALAPLPRRLLAALRPLICPFAPLVAQVPSGSRVLDIGCGNGLLLWTLARHGRVREGVGIDVAPSAVKVAQRVAASQSLPLRFRLAATTDDEATDPFDVVCLVDVMHHVPLAQRRRFLLDALARVGHQGRLVLKDMCHRPAWRVAWNWLHDLLLARQWVHVMPLDEMLGWAREAGFEVAARGSHVAAGVYGHEWAVLRRASNAPAPSASVTAVSTAASANRCDR